MIRLIVPLLILLFTFGARAEWIDQSHEIFLTKKLNAVTTRYREFPVFWWNFVVIPAQTQEQGEDFCRELRARWADAIAKLPCDFSPAQLATLTGDWLKDLRGRETMPAPDKWPALMDAVLTKASMPLPRELLNLMRLDPLDSLGELRARLDRRQPFDLPMRGGMIIDAEKKEIWLPVQLNYSPTDTKRTAALMNKINAPVFGPHYSTWENETRIRADIDVVSVVGTASLVLLALFVILTGRHKIVWLIPILLLGLGVATAATVVLFGKIHGITLAFGPGIVGLAMDYGVHAVFMDPRSKSTWKSNLAGLVTTLAILVILVFSQVPLLKQLMFFSAFGLIFSFVLFYVFLHLKPQFFVTAPYGFTPKTWRTGEYVAFTMLAACVLVFARPLDLSIQHLNYESPKTRELRAWFGKHTSSLQPYWLEEDAADPLGSSFATKEWAEKENIPYEGVANFVAGDQAKNAKTWQPLCDGQIRKTLIQTQFFEPFFSSFPCVDYRPRDLSTNVPDYIRDFSAQGQWAGLLFPENTAQTAKVKERYPSATTPREIFSEFPKIFLSELAWMIPVAFLTALAFLYFHFRRFGFTLLSIVPFLTGVGCYALIAVAFQLPLSFISLIGLLMVFGFSLDYGIFVVDLLRDHNENKYGVWSALSVCSFSAVAGFAPLVFAGHPVLNDLGQTLLWGSLGTFIGTFWGIPGLYRRIFA